MIENTQVNYMAQAEARAQRYLQAIAKTAEESGVPCETQCVTDEHPYEGIIRIAKTRDCDLVVMSSHGRSGLKALFLGSTTQKMLAHSPL